MLSVSFIITMTVATIVFIGVSRWQTVGSDRQKLADRAKTLDVLGSIVDRHAHTPVDTSQGVRNRPVDAQRRVARPLPAAFNVLGPNGAVIPPPISPRLASHDVAGNASGATAASPVSPQPGPNIPAADIPGEVVHRQMLRLSSVDLPDDPCGTTDHDSRDRIDLTGELTGNLTALDKTAPQQDHDGPALPGPQPHGVPLAAVGPSSSRRSSSSRRPASSRGSLSLPREQSTHLHRRRRLAAVAAAISLIAAVGFASNWNSDGATTSSAASGDTATASDDPVTDAVTPASPAPSIPLAPGMVVGDVAAFDVAAPFTLDLAADQPSWVQVRNRSGQVLFEQTLQPGQSTQVDVDQPVAVRTGNPAGLAVTAGFVPLDHPRPAGQPMTLHLG
jgi:hypothetical protein